MIGIASTTQTRPEQTQTTTSPPPETVKTETKPDNPDIITLSPEEKAQISQAATQSQQPISIKNDFKPVNISFEVGRNESIKSEGSRTVETDRKYDLYRPSETLRGGDATLREDGSAYQDFRTDNSTTDHKTREYKDKYTQNTVETNSQSLSLNANVKEPFFQQGNGTIYVAGGLGGRVVTTETTTTAETGTNTEHYHKLAEHNTNQTSYINTASDGNQTRINLEPSGTISKEENTISNNPRQVNTTTETTQTPYLTGNVGLGAEYKISPHLTLGAELGLTSQLELDKDPSIGTGVYGKLSSQWTLSEGGPAIELSFGHRDGFNFLGLGAQF